MKKSSHCPYFPQFCLRPLKNSMGLLMCPRTVWSLGLGSRWTWIRILTPPWISCVIWCTLFPLSEPQFPICEMRTITVPATAILGELNVCRGQAHGRRSGCFPAWCLPALLLPMAPHCPQGSLPIQDLRSGSWTHQTLQILG